MSTVPQTTVDSDKADAERALLVKLRDIDITFRRQVNARIEELTSGAGADALDFLLHPENTKSEESALSTKARADSLADGLKTYSSALRHYVDVPGATQVIRGIAGVVESMRDFQRGEARTFALQELEGHPNSVSDGKNRKLALKTHSRAEGSEEFVQMLRTAYALLLQNGADAGQAS